MDPRNQKESRNQKDPRALVVHFKKWQRQCCIRSSPKSKLEFVIWSMMRKKWLPDFFIKWLQIHHNSRPFVVEMVRTIEETHIWNIFQTNAIKGVWGHVLLHSKSPMRKLMSELMFVILKIVRVMPHFISGPQVNFNFSLGKKNTRIKSFAFLVTWLSEEWIFCQYDFVSL